MSEGLYKALQRDHRACMLSLEEEAKERRAESIKETSSMQREEVYVPLGRHFIAVSSQEATQILRTVDRTHSFLCKDIV